MAPAPIERIRRGPLIRIIIRGTKAVLDEMRRIADSGGR
jgi:hypothetical protein